MKHGAGWLSLAAVGLVIAGCAQKPPPQVSTTRLYAIDQQGAAPNCKVSPNISLTAGKQTDATMAVGNNGGWCAISVAQPGPHPYNAGLLTARPAHGKVYIHTVGDNTRIDYTPDSGFAGADSFTATLLPGNAAIRVAVTVTPR
jgi:hypothetical protein